jgi:hypothetical protein
LLIQQLDDNHTEEIFGKLGLHFLSGGFGLSGLVYLCCRIDQEQHVLKMDFPRIYIMFVGT